MRFWVFLLAAALLAPACAGNRAPGGAPGAPAARAAVERFVQLAGEKDYVRMGWLFGTAEGPIMDRDPAAEVEQRMYAIATVLQHDAYAIEGERPIPGRTGEAVEYTAALTRAQQTYRVPFTVVRGPDGRWYVERIGLEAITNVR